MAEVHGKEGDERVEKLAVDGGRRGLLREVLDWIGTSGKWWLVPILLGLLLVGVLVSLGGSVLAPFIYPLF